MLGAVDTVLTAGFSLTHARSSEVLDPSFGQGKTLSLQLRSTGNFF